MATRRARQLAQAGARSLAKITLFGVDNTFVEYARRVVAVSPEEAERLFATWRAQWPEMDRYFNTALAIEALRNDMTPEEARARLRQLLDEQAEAFRALPAVFYTDHLEARPRNGARHYIRVFATLANGEIECIDFLLARAAGIQYGDWRHPRENAFSLENGFVMSSSAQDVRGLLTAAGLPKDYVAAMTIREIP